MEEGGHEGHSWLSEDTDALDRLRPESLYEDGGIYNRL